MRLLALGAAVALVACTQPGTSRGGEAASVDGNAAPGPGSKPGSHQATVASGVPSGSTAVIGSQAAGGVDEPCTLANTSGVWSMVHIESAEPGVQAFYRSAPFEYMRIGPTGAYAYFATNQAVGAADVRGRIDQADAADGVNDRADFREPGLFVVLRDDQPFQAVRCVIVGGAGANHRAGDMVWTEYEGMADLYRVQRRMD